MKCFEQDEHEKKLEKMGVELSQKLEWNGFDILRVSVEALTDANFHTEAKIINDMLRKLENDPMRN